MIYRKKQMPGSYRSRLQQRSVYLANQILITQAQKRISIESKRKQFEEIASIVLDNKKLSQRQKLQTEIKICQLGFNNRILGFEKQILQIKLKMIDSQHKEQLKKQKQRRVQTQQKCKQIQQYAKSNQKQHKKSNTIQKKNNKIKNKKRQQQGGNQEIKPFKTQVQNQIQYFKKYGQMMFKKDKRWFKEKRLIEELKKIERQNNFNR